jgi:phosphoserine phosphatase RsbU/P
LEVTGKSGGYVRLASAILAALAVCGVVQAQTHPPPHSPNPLGAVLAPHGKHAPPRPVSQQHTQEVYVDATALGSPVRLDRNWRVGITADPAAANADYDDSTWAVRNATEAFADVPDQDRPPGTANDPDFNNRKTPRHQRPWAWFRLHIHLAPNHGPVALLIALPVSHTTNVSIGEGITPEVFMDGKVVRPDGPHGDRPERYQSISRLYRLDVPASETTMVLAIRTIFIPVGYASYTTFFANRTLTLGAPEDLTRILDLWVDNSMFERLPRLVMSILLVVLAAFLLALYFTQRGHTEYLWLALHELAQAPIGFFEYAGSSARLDTLWYGATVLQLVLLSAYFYFEFLVAFLYLRERWEGRKKLWIIRLMRYTAPILAVVGPMVLLVGHGSIFVVVVLAVAAVISVLWIACWLLFCVTNLIAATMRRNFEAGLLLFPMVLTLVGLLEGVFSGTMADWTGHSYQSPLTMQVGPIPIHFATIADFIGVLAIVVIIFFRFLRIHRDRERASSELAAARSVQELLIPQMTKTPGFEVDSIYNPAAEVGGDFYHVEPTIDGGLLVVIGDVAGKGLKAAMNVSMVMGALRRNPERSPSKILESLNRVLIGSDGFTTCQAVWFAPNGEVVIANAGHLPPYLNTQEVNLPGGLPLGILNEITYEEVRLYVHPGDRLLLMSDGVVEARHEGGELFGFERVHNLSNQSAFYIADAAKSFGQEDDITVLTVRRLGTAVAA